VRLIDDGVDIWCVRLSRTGILLVLTVKDACRSSFDQKSAEGSKKRNSNDGRYGDEPKFLRWQFKAKNQQDDRKQKINVERQGQRPKGGAGCDAEENPCGLQAV
jgi:hypothetical protein